MHVFMFNVLFANFLPGFEYLHIVDVVVCLVWDGERQVRAAGREHEPAAGRGQVQAGPALQGALHCSYRIVQSDRHNVATELGIVQGDHHYVPLELYKVTIIM